MWNGEAEGVSIIKIAILTTDSACQGRCWCFCVPVLFLIDVGTIPCPSLIVITWSAATEPILSTAPDGQCTSMESTVVAGPSPKCSRGSLADSKLELARTSADWVKAPAFTCTRAPKPSWFDRTPTVLISSQCPFGCVRLRSSNGGESKTLTRRSYCPSLKKSAVAAPRPT